MQPTPSVYCYLYVCFQGWRSVRGDDPSTILEVWFTKEIHLTAVNARAVGSGQLNLIA